MAIPDDTELMNGDRVTVRVALDAMATRFELVMIGHDAARLRACGEAVFREIRSIEKRFSFYSPTSEISNINRRAADKPVRIAPDLFDLLSTSLSLTRRTHGAFDAAMGPLMRCWGFYRGSGEKPDAEALDQAKIVSGSHHIRLDSSEHTVSFDRAGVEIDLGGIAKGYAIDEAASILTEAGIENALLHGGTSTVWGMGTSYNGSPWRVAIAERERVLGTVELTNRAVSVSASSGKSFMADGVRLGHIMDPRNGEPAEGAAVAAVTSVSATESDALSTAALVLHSGADELATEAVGVAVWSNSDDPELFFSRNLPGFSQDPL